MHNYHIIILGKGERETDSVTLTTSDFCIIYREIYNDTCLLLFHRIHVLHLTTTARGEDINVILLKRNMLLIDELSVTAILFIKNSWSSVTKYVSCKLKH